MVRAAWPGCEYDEPAVERIADGRKLQLLDAKRAKGDDGNHVAGRPGDVSRTPPHPNPGRRIMGLLPPALRRWLADLRDWLAECPERFADAIKSFMIDGGTANRQRSARELPPMDPERFVEAARGRVEATLRQVAAAVNRAPTADLIAASEEEVRRLFGDLWWDVLDLGARMRVDVALAEFPPAPGGPRGWAAKYRRMVVARDCPELTEDAPPFLAR
jgi:hypothetical protein